MFDKKIIIIAYVIVFNGWWWIQQDTQIKNERKEVKGRVSKQNKAVDNKITIFNSLFPLFYVKQSFKVIEACKNEMKIIFFLFFVELRKVM